MKLCCVYMLFMLLFLFLFQPPYETRLLCAVYVFLEYLIDTLLLTRSVVYQHLPDIFRTAWASDSCVPLKMNWRLSDVLKHFNVQLWFIPNFCLYLHSCTNQFDFNQLTLNPGLSACHAKTTNSKTYIYVNVTCDRVNLYITNLNNHK